MYQQEKRKNGRHLEYCSTQSDAKQGKSGRRIPAFLRMGVRGVGTTRSRQRKEETKERNIHNCRSMMDVSSHLPYVIEP